MVEIPYLSNNETQETAFPSIGQGGSDVILAMGKTDNAQDLTTIHEFYSYYEALQTLGPASDTNELLSAIFDIFVEGSRMQSYQTPTISKVYAIEMGPNPTKSDYETAMNNSVIKRDIDIELFVNNHDVDNYIAHMNAVAAHLGTLENQNDYRQAIFTLDPTLSISDKALYTNTVEQSYIRDSRVILYENETLQAKYAAKVACTPYYIDPCQEPYRSVAVDDINEYTYADLETLVGAGITADYRTPSLNPDMIDCVTPVRSVSTAHRLHDSVRPLDSNTHVRRNVDYQWWYSDLLATQELKQNNTELTREHLLNAVTSFFTQQVQMGTIVPQLVAPKDPGFYVDVLPDQLDANKVHLLRRIRPVSAIYFIEIDSVIHSPPQQPISKERLRSW
jgi:hypothetical protein